MILITAIVSGGQTGADRGGLDAAIQLGLGHGGWAPKGWRAEDGVIPEIYRAHMRESVSEDYGVRTRLNVQDSDGTLIISFGEELTGGSEYTAKQARAQRKPCKHLVLPARGDTRIPDAVRSAALQWVNENRISILNVAGPRESKEAGLQTAVRDALVWIFEDEVVDVVERVQIGPDGQADESTRSIHTIGCDHVDAAGFNCAGCERDLCWGCEMPLRDGSEVKTAVRWCKADGCRRAEHDARFGATLP